MEVSGQLHAPAALSPRTELPLGKGQSVSGLGALPSRSGRGEGRKVAQGFPFCLRTEENYGT
jgi:hypothetical protein